MNKGFDIHPPGQPEAGSTLYTDEDYEADLRMAPFSASAHMRYEQESMRRIYGPDVYTVMIAEIICVQALDSTIRRCSRVDLERQHRRHRT